MAEIASKYELHSSQISDWKKQVLTTGSSLFEPYKSAKDSSAKADNSDKLYEQIGRLQRSRPCGREYFCKKSYREL